MIVLCCGGRGYFGDVDNALDILHSQQPVTLLVHGGAPGADSRSGDWARKNNIHVAEVRALWDNFGKGAGSKRNQSMLLLNINYVVAFPGGSGTYDMVERATKHGLTVWRPYD